MAAKSNTKDSKSTLKDLSAFLQNEKAGKAGYLEQAAATLSEVERVSAAGELNHEHVMAQLAKVMLTVSQAEGLHKRQLFYELAELLLAEEQHASDAMLLNTVYYLRYAEELEGS